MLRKTIPLLTVLAALFVATGGVAAADAGTNATTAEKLTNESTANDSAEVGICVVGVDSPCNGDDVDDSGMALDGNDTTPPARADESTSSESNGSGAGGEAGICLVGADSACNGGEAGDSGAGDSSDGSTDSPTHPTPTNVSERVGEGSDGHAGDDAGICLVGADSACNGETTAANHTGSEGHSGTDRGTAIGGSGSDDGGQMWIPEDQNRDGEIDDRFFGMVELFADSSIEIPVPVALL